MHRSEVRQRTRDLAWHEQRTHAETVACVAGPKGCAMPAGTTCRDRFGVELTNQPAHVARIARADQPPPPPPGHPTSMESADTGGPASSAWPESHSATQPPVDDVPLPPEPDDEPDPEEPW